MANEKISQLTPGAPALLTDLIVIARGGQNYSLPLSAVVSLVTGSQTATPAFAPAGGTYTSIQSVTISCATPGATIYYTTDGSTPTTASAVYTTPLTVATSETINAIAIAAGFSQSAVGSASYTINISFAFNPMGIAIGANGVPALDEVDFPIFQDCIRSCRAFTQAAAPGVQATLDANGWPTQDWLVVIHENGAAGAIAQSWQTAGGPAAVASASQTVANPGVFATASQAYTAGQLVQITGTPPGGFAINTNYYVIAAGLTSTTCQLSATQGGAGIQVTSSSACTITPSSTFACGFTGVGTVAVNNGCTIGNIVVTGSGATQTTTFDMWPDGGQTTYAWKVTGTTPGVGNQNVFCYLPAYRASQFNAGNVNGYSATSLFTTESITFGKQFGWIRDMFYRNAWGNTQANTSTTRRTPANCKCNQFFATNQSDGYPVDWLIDYLLAIRAAGGGTGLYHHVPANCDTTFLAADIVSLQRLPAGIPIIIEWANELWNGQGRAGLVLVQLSGGSSASANFTGTISGTSLTVSGLTGTITPGSSCYVLGAGVAANTNVVSGSGPYTVSVSQSVGPIAMQVVDYNSMYRYLGTLIHNFAAMLRTAFGARFGTDVVINACSQQGSNGPSFLATMFNYMVAQGYTPNADLHYLGVAPYINTTSPTLSWTVSQIETNLTSGSGQSTQNVINNCKMETYSTLARYWGLKGVLTYEGGWQTNAENSGLINGGAAAMDSGMTAIESAIWAGAFNAGAIGITRHDGFCSSIGGNLGPIDDLSNNFQTLITSGSPRLAAMQIYIPGTYVRTKNIAATGQTFDARAYTDNPVTGAFPVFNNFGQAPPFYFGAGGLNGAYTYNIYVPVAANLAFAVDFTNTSASAANCNVRLDGVQVVTGVGVVPGSGTNGGVNTVTLGTLALSKGFHELTVGPFTSLTTLSATNLFHWT